VLSEKDSYRSYYFPEDVSSRATLGVFYFLGLYDDALSAVKFVQNHQKLDPHRIVLHGRSLGGAVAIYVASQLSSADIYAVILENTFTSLPNIAKCVLSIAPVKVSTPSQHSHEQLDAIPLIWYEHMDTLAFKLFH